MKDVVISINSIHRLEDSEPDRIDFTTDGKYSYEDGTGYLSYMESEVTGLPGTRTSVEIRPDEVIVDRTGSITSRMVFRRGEKNSFQYETPYGMATLGMSTQRIRHDIDPAHPPRHRRKGRQRGDRLCARRRARGRRAQPLHAGGSGTVGADAPAARAAKKQQHTREPRVIRPGVRSFYSAFGYSPHKRR